MRRDRKVLPPEGGKLFAIVSKHSGFPVFSTFAHNRIACVRNATETQTKYWWHKHGYFVAEYEVKPTGWNASI